MKLAESRQQKLPPLGLKKLFAYQNFNCTNQRAPAITPGLCAAAEVGLQHCKAKEKEAVVRNGL